MSNFTFNRDFQVLAALSAGMTAAKSTEAPNKEPTLPASSHMANSDTLHQYQGSPRLISTPAIHILGTTNENTR